MVVDALTWAGADVHAVPTGQTLWFRVKGAGSNVLRFWPIGFRV